MCKSTFPFTLSHSKHSDVQLCPFNIMFYLRKFVFLQTCAKVYLFWEQWDFWCFWQWPHFDAGFLFFFLFLFLTGDQFLCTRCLFPFYLFVSLFLYLYLYFVSVSITAVSYWFFVSVTSLVALYSVSIPIFSYWYVPLFPLLLSMLISLQFLLSFND